MGLTVLRLRPAKTDIREPSASMRRFKDCVSIWKRTIALELVFTSGHRVALRIGLPALYNLRVRMSYCEATAIVTVFDVLPPMDTTTGTADRAGSLWHLGVCGTVGVQPHFSRTRLSPLVRCSFSGLLVQGAQGAADGAIEALKQELDVERFGTRFGIIWHLIEDEARTDIGKIAEN